MKQSVLVWLVFSLSFLTLSLKIKTKSIKMWSQPILENYSYMYIVNYWVSKTVLCWAECSHCIVYIWWYFYQLITHKELLKCIKESKDTQEFVHCTEMHTEIGCKETAVEYFVLLGLHLETSHPVFSLLDVFGLCCIHISVKLHQSSYGSIHTYSKWFKLQRIHTSLF